MTVKEIDIAEPTTDIYEWIKILCNDFDGEFKKAEHTIKYFNIQTKWYNLIKNCKDP